MSRVVSQSSSLPAASQSSSTSSSVSSAASGKAVVEDSAALSSASSLQADSSIGVTTAEQLAAAAARWAGLLGFLNRSDCFAAVAPPELPWRAGTTMPAAFITSSFACAFFAFSFSDLVMYVPDAFCASTLSCRAFLLRSLSSSRAFNSAASRSSSSLILRSCSSCSLLTRASSSSSCCFLSRMAFAVAEIGAGAAEGPADSFLPPFFFFFFLSCDHPATYKS